MVTAETWCNVLFMLKSISRENLVLHIEKSKIGHGRLQEVFAYEELQM